MPGKKLCAGALAVLLGICTWEACSPGDQPGPEPWKARPNKINIACDIVADAIGNVYVLGSTFTPLKNWDCLLVKFDSQGRALWAFTYDGPAQGHDKGCALALDKTGHLLIAGSSENTHSGADFLIVKVDAGGQMVWEARYNGPRSSHDYPTDLIVDHANNVVVTGYSIGTDSGFDFATVKYTPDGKRCWIARFDGPRSEFDRACALACDAEGCIYVTGYSTGSASGFDFTTIKYDPSGMVLWNAITDRAKGDRAEFFLFDPGRYSVEDMAAAIVLGRHGEVYVAGKSGINFKDQDYAVVKYDPSGKLVWKSRYNGPSNNGDEAIAIATDAKGDLFITGRSAQAKGGYDYATMKLNEAGQTLWTARFDGSEWNLAKELAFDPQGILCVTGESQNAQGNLDLVSVLYDLQGQEIDRIRFDGRISGNDHARSLATDGKGHLYAVGDSVYLPAEKSITPDGQTTELIVVPYSLPPAGSNRSSGSLPERPASSAKLPKPKGYQFSEDFLGWRMPLWREILAPLRGRTSTRYLEIGVFEGRSAFWVMENILIHPSSRLTAVDIFESWYEDIFLANLKKSGLQSKVTILKGPSQIRLRQLPPDSYDLIYIDGSHIAVDVFQDIALSWGLLKSGGIMILDDYKWEIDKPKEGRPETAIDAFLSVFKNEIEILHRGNDIIVKKS